MLFKVFFHFSPLSFSFKICFTEIIVMYSELLSVSTKEMKLLLLSPVGGCPEN